MLRLRPGRLDFSAVLVGAVPRGTERREAGYAQRLLWAAGIIALPATEQILLTQPVNPVTRAGGGTFREEDAGDPGTLKPAENRIKRPYDQGGGLPLRIATRRLLQLETGAATGQSSADNRESLVTSFLRVESAGERSLAAQEDRLPDGHVDRALAEVEARRDCAPDQRLLEADARAPRGRALGPDQRERLVCGVDQRDGTVPHRQVRAGAAEERGLCGGQVPEVHNQVQGVKDQAFAFQDDHTGQGPDHLQVRAVDPDDGMEAGPRSDQPGLAGNTEIVDRKRPLVGDLDRPPGLVESQAERGKECWLTRSGDTADLDQGALDPCGNGSQRPFRQVFPQRLFGVGGRDGRRRVNVHGLDSDGSRPLHWLHSHGRDREGRLLSEEAWSGNRPRNLIGRPVRGLAPVALRLFWSDR